MVSPVGRLAPSGAATVELVLRLLAAGTFTVRGEVSLAGADPVADNNRSSAMVEVGRPPSRVRRHLAGHASRAGL